MPTPPGATSPSRIIVIAAPPATAVRESCEEFTAPVEVAVVEIEKIEASCTLLRISLPSRFGACTMPAAVSAGVVRVSAVSEIAYPAPSRISMAPRIARPSFMRPSMRPYRNGNENGISNSTAMCRKSVNGVPDSNGCAELALKKPPPLVPSCLIATWLAAGPRVIVCAAPSSVVTCAGPSNVITTPRATRTTPITSERGIRT